MYVYQGCPYKSCFYTKILVSDGHVVHRYDLVNKMYVPTGGRDVALGAKKVGTRDKTPEDSQACIYVCMYVFTTTCMTC